MNVNFSHEIVKNPVPEDVDTLTITARIFGRGPRGSDDPLTFTTSCYAEEYLDDEQDEIKSKDDLTYFLIESQISNADIDHAWTNLIEYVPTCSESPEYFPGCALHIRLDFVPETDPAKVRPPLREVGCRAVPGEDGEVKFVDIFTGKELD